jgi:hypothetical protein
MAIQTPPIISRVPLKNACGVAAYGSFAFVACQEQGVFGVDLSNPAKPDVKGALTAAGMDARKLFSFRELLLLAGFGGGLFVYDVRDPRSPMYLSRLTSAAVPYVENMFMWGQYAMVVGGDGVNARFAVIDLRNPRYPQVAGLYTHVTPETTNYTSVGFDGRLAYVGTSSGEVHVLSMANLQRIQRVGEYFAPKVEFKSPTIWGIVAFPGRLFVVDWGAGLIVLDTQNPSSPRPVGVFSGGGAGGANAYRVAVEPSVAYLANGWGGLIGVDITNPANMRALFEVAPRQASFVDVAIAGPLALVANNGVPQGLDVVSLRG